MKKIFLILLVSLFCTSMLSSCKDDDKDIPSVPKSDRLGFDSEILDCYSTSEELVFKVKWNKTGWQASTSEGKIIDDFFPQSGGNSSEDGETEITVKLLPNNGDRSRTQSIVFTDDSGAKRSVLIRQNTLLDIVEIYVNPTAKYQYVVGFGAMHNPIIWTPSLVPTAKDVTYAYSPDGLGLTMQRLMIYPDAKDFSTDVEAAKIAQGYGATIFACPWDCKDDWCDQVTATVDGQERTIKHLKPEHYEDYARHLCNYVEYMKRNGVNIYAITTQNEPDGTFVHWSADEIVKFSEEYGAMIRSTGVKLMAPETMGILESYTDALYANDTAWDNTDIVALHLYTGFLQENNSWCQSRRDYIEQFNNTKLFPESKSWWMTEHLFNDGENETDQSKWLFAQWDYCFDTLAREIYESLERGCSAYVYWYLKRFYGLLGDTNTKSPVAEGQPTKNGYIISHYSKVASSSKRIQAVSDNETVLVQAFVSETNNVSIVILNRGEQAKTISIPMNVTSAKAFSTGSTFSAEPVTCRIEGGIVSLNIQPKSITSIETTGSVN